MQFIYRITIVHMHYKFNTLFGCVHRIYIYIHTSKCSVWDPLQADPDGPGTQSLMFPVPETIPSMAVAGSETSNIGYLGLLGED